MVWDSTDEVKKRSSWIKEPVDESRLKNIKVEIGYAVTNREEDRKKEMIEDRGIRITDKILSKKKIAAII